MILLDGNTVAARRAELLRTRIQKLGVTPKIVIVRVGERFDAISYVRKKVEFAQSIGAIAEERVFPEDVSEETLLAAIGNINADDTVHGLIVQLPLPAHLSRKEIIDAIYPKKDVDGLTHENAAKLFKGETDGIVPATPRGVLTLLQSYDIDVAGKHVVVVGRSLLVGKSAAVLLLNKDATVTVCHSKTQNLAAITKTADILIVATGKQKCIGAEHVREGQVVVDVGIGADDDGKLAGDVDFDAVKDIVTAISPVPGGVGPMTVCSLYENLVDAIDIQRT